MITHYVLGFMFSECKRNVVLIEKNRPEWQAGLLNGVGGHVEDFDESSHAALVREFEEETGVLQPTWTHYAHLGSPDKFSMDVYYSTGNTDRVQTMTDERITTKLLTRLPYCKIVSNLYWLIPLALDCMDSPKAINTNVIYS